jgi:hypothetical protein
VGVRTWKRPADGAKNGLFTQTLLEVWKKVRSRASNSEFHSSIATKTNERRLKMYPYDETQQPNRRTDGPNDARFPQKQAPFVIVPKPWIAS